MRPLAAQAHEILEEVPASVATLAKTIEHASVPVISRTRWHRFLNTGAECVFGLPAKKVIGRSSLVAPSCCRRVACGMPPKPGCGEPIHPRCNRDTGIGAAVVGWCVAREWRREGGKGLWPLGGYRGTKRGATRQAAIYTISAAVSRIRAWRFRTIHQSISESSPRELYIALYVRTMVS
jgi:hypothetical protein